MWGRRMSEEMKSEQEVKQRKPRIFKRAAHVYFSLSGAAAVAFKELLKTFAYAIDDYELPISIEADKLVIRSMDSSRVSMANYELSRMLFDEWHVRPMSKYEMADLPIRLTVPISEVNYALEKVGEDSKVAFEFPIIIEEWKSKVEVEVRKPERCPRCGLYTFESANLLPPDKRGKDGRSFKCKCGWRGKVKVRKRKVKVVNRRLADASNLMIEVRERTVEKFKVNVFATDFEVPPLPKLEHKFTAKVAAKEFREILLRMQKKMNSVKFTGTESKLLLSGEGDMIEMAVELEKNTDILLDIKTHEEQKALYSLDHIIPILPSKPSIAQIVGLKFSTDNPLIVSWFVEHCPDWTVDFYVAPLIR